MAQRLLVEIVGDSKSVERAFARTERSATRFQATMARTSKSVNSSLGAFGLSPGLTAAGGALLLGSQFVKAARNAEIILGQTEVAFRDAGLSWVKYSKQVQDASTTISQSSAFDDEAVLQSIQVFIRGQKDAGRSIELAGLAADVARGRYIDLDQATQLVNKAAMGQIGALRRAGIQIDKNASSAEALDALQRAYAGSAEKYANSSVGATEKLSVAWENLAEQAGGPLTEALAGVATQLTIIVGLMEKAGGLKFPGVPGGNLGGALKFLAMHTGPGGAFTYAKALLDLTQGKGGANLNTPSAGFGSIFKQTNAAFAKGGFGDMFAPFFGAVSAAQGIGQGIRGGLVDQAIANANKSISDMAAFVNKYADVGRKWEAAQKAAAARRARNALARQRFAAGLENQWGWLEFGLERAQATKTLADDRRILKKQEQWLLNRIAHAGHTLELSRRLWSVRDQIRNLNKSKAKGGADGDPLAGLMQVSSKQMAGILAQGTGLSAYGRNILAANIAGAEIHTYVHLDGREVARSVNRSNARTANRTSAQTSGRRG